MDETSARNTSNIVDLDAVGSWVLVWIFGSFNDSSKGAWL